MKNHIKKNMTRMLCLLTAALFLSSCGGKKAQVSTKVGVGRDKGLVSAQKNAEKNDGESESGETSPEGESGESESGEGETDYTPPPLGKNDENSASEISWKVENGKYTYTLPKRDDSGLKTISEMNSTSTALFDDQGDDLTGSWYFGKTNYDESTGEVSYVWDRYQSTLDLMDKYGGIYRGDTENKVCYLTFDCGYEYGPTTDILDTLKEKQAPGIFFLTGHYVKSSADIIKRMLDEGHLVGNHTVNHTNLTQVSADKMVEELEGLEDLFYEKFPDAQPMLFMRPPSGGCNEWVLKLADKMGYRTVMWSWAYKDYDTENQPDPADALAKAKSGLHPGCVYLFHTESTTNAAILGDLIDWIRGQGYEIKPICDIPRAQVTG